MTNNINSSGYNVDWRQYHFQASAELHLAMLEKEFAPFLSPHPRVQTSGRALNEPLLGVIARWQGQVVGLIVVERISTQSGLVVCWHVIKSHHGFALGKKLILQMQQFSKANGLLDLSVSYREDSAFNKQITKTLHRLGWESPKKELMLYKFSPALFMQQTWVKKILLPTGFKIFSWDTLTAQDKHHIQDRQKKSNWHPKSLSPFIESLPFETANSLGLRNKQGHVIGWLITHRVHTDVIEYSSLFVSPELQDLARGYHLIVEAIKRQHALGISRAIFQVKIENTAALSFVENRMEKTITAQTSRCFSKKQLV